MSQARRGGARTGTAAEDTRDSRFLHRDDVETAPARTGGTITLPGLSSRGEPRACPTVPE
ncbi:hypothetical protein JCM13580A_11050 [Streptomyces drozdowiczii]